MWTCPELVLEVVSSGQQRFHQVDYGVSLPGPIPHPHPKERSSERGQKASERKKGQVKDVQRSSQIQLQQLSSQMLRGMFMATQAFLALKAERQGGVQKLETLGLSAQALWLAE